MSQRPCAFTFLLTVYIQRMASFGWKRKVGEKVSKSVVQQFESEAEKAEGDGAGVAEEEVDWLHAVKRRRELLLEDCAAKSKRLEDEGALLAEQGRHWEAIKKWDEAIQLTPDNPLLYEMKSQVLTILQEVFPAVKAAEMAVKFRPLWWEGWQTLGRAQLNLGEVDLAVRSFQVAIHLCPSERTLWQEDLAWAWKLQKQDLATKEKIRQEEEAKEQILNAPGMSVVVNSDGNVQNVLIGEGKSEDTATPSKEQFVKARGL